MKLIRDWFTEDDGVSWCIGRAIGFAASVELMYKFAITDALDYISFGAAICAIIAAVAAKNLSERK